MKASFLQEESSLPRKRRHQMSTVRFQALIRDSGAGPSPVSPTITSKARALGLCAKTRIEIRRCAIAEPLAKYPNDT
ncbi:hypothetical protein GCM10007937_36950 [Mesorhizobium albiziae]|nr:hypothetical protein GCM10007937_36950 [Mesorhizobium albiziae]